MYCSKQFVGQTSYNMRHHWAGHKYAFGKVHKLIYMYYHFIKIHLNATLYVHITLLESVLNLKARLDQSRERMDGETGHTPATWSRHSFQHYRRLRLIKSSASARSAPVI